MSRNALFSVLLLIGFSSSAQSQVSAVPNEPRVENTRQFWMDSKVALTSRFLIKVFLPPDYGASDTSRFPVVYMTDADGFWGAATDFPWFLHFPNPQIILVGISYGGWTEGWAPAFKREIDFNYLPNKEGIVGADRFMRFFSDELIPRIDSAYRTDKSSRTLFGWSSGAYFATYVLFTRPGTFNNYLVLGCAPDDQHHPLWKLEEEYYAGNKDLPVKLYLGAGNFDYWFRSVKRFAGHVKERHYGKLQMKYEVIENFRHSYQAAVALMAKGLEYVFLKAPLYDEMLRLAGEQGIDSAIQAYHQMKKGEWDKYDFSEEGLNILGYYFLNVDNFDAAIKVLKLNADEYPQSANAFDSLTDAYLAAGDAPNTVVYVKKLLEVLEKYPDATTASEKEDFRQIASEKLARAKAMK